MKAFTVEHECGFKANKRTEGLARRALGMHSCEHQKRLQERAERVAARLAASGPVRDCEHKFARHEHGTDIAYKADKCRCRPCKDAHSAANIRRERLKAYGRDPVGRVEAGPVRAHLNALAAAGFGYKQVANLSGVSPSAVAAILHGRPERGHAPYARVGKATAARILAVKPTPENRAGGALVNATGAHRRLQALVTIGWPLAQLAARLDLAPSNITALLKRDRLTAAIDMRIRNLYDQLWNHPYTGIDHRSRIAESRARRYARTRGWLPPLAWDDESIDDPATLPNADLASGKVEAQIENLEFLVNTGAPLAEIVQRMGVGDWARLQRYAHRWGRYDLITRIKSQTVEQYSGRAS